MRRPRLSVSAPWLLLSAPQASLCFAFVARPTGSLNRCLWSAHGSCSWPRCCARPTSLLRPQPSSLHRRFHPALSIRQPTPRGLATAPAGGFDASLRGTKANSDAGAGENQFNLEAEIKRLMSVPTIDIKLELQMRGVEHRDAFEKIDLANRLAEARLRSPSATGGKRGNVFPSEVPRHVGEATGWAQGEGEAETRTASADDGSSNPSSSGRPRGWSATPKSASSSSRTAARENQQEEENAEKQVGEESEGEYHARCVSRAVRMGKPAIVRELNAMGIAHSRLSDVNVLARQYASAKVEARGEAQAREPDLFVADGGLVQRLEAARLRSLGRDELTARLRALKVDFSTRDSEIDLALLLQKAGGGDGVAVVTAGASKVSEEEGEKGSRNAFTPSALYASSTPSRSRLAAASCASPSAARARTGVSGISMKRKGKPNNMGGGGGGGGAMDPRRQQEMNLQEERRVLQSGMPAFQVFVKTRDNSMWFPCGMMMGDDKAKATVDAMMGGPLAGVSRYSLEKGVAGSVLAKRGELARQVTTAYPQLKNKELTFGFKIVYRDLEEKLGKQKVIEITKDMTLGPLDAFKKKMGWG